MYIYSKANIRLTVLFTQTGSSAVSYFQSYVDILSLR